MEPIQPNPQILIDLLVMKMPFGKHKGVTLANLPINYLEWFHSEGLPPGKLGMLLATIYEIKINGLEKLLDPIRRKMQMHQ